METLLTAADGLLALANEVLEYDPSAGEHAWPDLIARIGPVVEKYFAERAAVESAVPVTQRDAIDAADELANWLADLADVQAESSSEEWKSLLGVQGAVLYYNDKRGPNTRFRRG